MPEGIDRNLVPPPSVTKGYILPQEVEYKVKRGVGVLWTERLKAGEYKPVVSNDKGTFYLGPPMAITRWLGEKELRSNNGGFWISKDETQKPRLWFYILTLPSAMKKLKASDTAQPHCLRRCSR